MVRWRESVLHMAGEGVDTLIEIGAGRVLTGLAQGVSTGRLAQARSGTVAEVDALLGQNGLVAAGSGSRGRQGMFRSVGKGGR